MIMGGKKNDGGVLAVLAKTSFRSDERLVEVVMVK